MRQKTWWMKPTFTAALLLVTLVGCENSTQQTGNNSQTPAPTATATPTPTATPTLASIPLTFNGPADADLQGLHIHSEDGMFCGGHPVLKDPQYTYDATTQQEMVNYLETFAQTTDWSDKTPYNAVTAASLPALPDTLEVVPGGLAGRILLRDGAANGACVGRIIVTNTSSEDIEIEQIGATLTRPTTQNSFTYRLLAICPLLGVTDPRGCGPGFSGAGCFTTAAIQLPGGTTGTHIDSPIGGDCPTLLSPRGNMEIPLEISSSVPGLLYRIRLTLTITSTAGTRTFDLPSAFDSTLVFVNPTQYSCYELQNTTFVSVPVNPTICL